jgi:hypothetical protein
LPLYHLFTCCALRILAVIFFVLFVVAAAFATTIRFLVRRMRFKKGLASFVCVLFRVLLFLFSAFYRARLVKEHAGCFRSYGGCRRSSEILEQLG